MPKVMHLIDHNGLGGAQRVVAGILAHRSGDLVFPLRTMPQAMFNPPEDYPQGEAGHPLLGLLQKIGPLRRWLKSHTVEIIHCHLQAGWITGIWLHWLERRQGNLRFLFHEHNPYILYSNSYRSLVRLAAKAGKVISVSEYLRERMRRIGIPDRRQATLPNYVAAQFFERREACAGLALEPGWREDNAVVGYAGRIVNIKGWQMMVQVAQALRHEAVRFLVAGTGKDEKRLRQAISNNDLEDKVRLLGFVEDMSCFYHAIDVLLFPSSFEVFGLAPLEAQACGVPVVATDIPGVNEVISQDNAMLLPKGDVQGMATAIQRLAADGGLRAHLAARGNRNAQQYTIEAYLPQLEQIYRSVLE